MQNLLFALYNCLVTTVSRVSAQTFDGDGLIGGIRVAEQVDGPLRGSLRGIILSFLYKALSFLSLAAIIMVIAAGFFLVFSNGDDTVKDKAKKMILYVVIGLVIVFMARSLVGLFVNGLQ